MPIVVAEKKPVQIQAMYHDGTRESALAITNWINSHGPEIRTEDYKIGSENYVVHIPTLEGVMKARRGWWVIQGVQGEFYPCEDSIFQETYNIKRYK